MGDRTAHSEQPHAPSGWAAVPDARGDLLTDANWTRPKLARYVRDARSPRPATPTAPWCPLCPAIADRNVPPLCSAQGQRRGRLLQPGDGAGLVARIARDAGHGDQHGARVHADQQPGPYGLPRHGIRPQPDRPRRLPSLPRVDEAEDRDAGRRGRPQLAGYQGPHPVHGECQPAPRHRHVARGQRGQPGRERLRVRGRAVLRLLGRRRGAVRRAQRAVRGSRAGRLPLHLATRGRRPHQQVRADAARDQRLQCARARARGAL